MASALSWSNFSDIHIDDALIAPNANPHAHALALVLVALPATFVLSSPRDHGVDPHSTNHTGNASESEGVIKESTISAGAIAGAVWPVLLRSLLDALDWTPIAV